MPTPRASPTGGRLRRLRQLRRSCPIRHCSAPHESQSSTDQSPPKSDDIAERCNPRLPTSSFDDQVAVHVRIAWELFGIKETLMPKKDENSTDGLHLLYDSRTFVP